MLITISHTNEDQSEYAEHGDDNGIYPTAVTVEHPEDVDEDIHSVLSTFKKALLAIGYQPGTVERIVVDPRN